MKKYFLFLSLILFISTFTGAVQYACPNQTQVISSSEEINEGELESILSIPLGVCGASENAYFKWIESTIFLDANVVSLYSSNETRGTELISGNKSISYSSISGEKVTLKIDSSTEELELGECSELGGLVAMINSIQNSGSPTDILVATKKIVLNTKQKPSEIIELNSKKYAVQLISGSSTQSTVKISKCNNGDIYEIPEEIPVQIQNTSNSTIINNTITNQTINDTIQINQTLNNSSELNNSSQELSDQLNKGLFRKIIDWLKNLFS